jgi:copper chaperone CopZ
MQATLEIQNLKCGGCANTISTRLKNLEGITDIAVNNETDSVSFDYNQEHHLEEAKMLLSKLGYPAVGEHNPLSKKAKSFVSCAVGRINK